VYYTPTYIVDHRQECHRLLEGKTPKQAAKLDLDPACGSGSFPSAHIVLLDCTATGVGNSLSVGQERPADLHGLGRWKPGLRLTTASASEFYQQHLCGH
jgi:hypothetical protein